MNEREKNLGIIVGTVVAVAAGYFAFDTFYWGPREDLEKRSTAAFNTLNDGKDLVRRDPTMQADFIRLNLFKTASDSASVISRVYELADTAQFNIINWSGSAGSRANAKSDIDEVRFTLTGTGGTPSLGRFLLSLQRVSRYQDAQMLPIRIDEVTINTRKEGYDELQATVTITALIFSPKTATGKPIVTTHAARASATTTASTRTGTTTRTATSTAPTTDEALRNEIERQMRERKQKEEEESAKRAASQPAESQPATAPATLPVTQPAGGAQ